MSDWVSESRQPVVDDRFVGLVDSSGNPNIALAKSRFGDLPKSAVLEQFAEDRWMQNIMLSIWEFANGVDTLESYPWNITLPIADICNARCTFCTSWLRGSNFLSPEEVERYEEVLPYAFHFGYQGHGEPLANPHIDTLMRHFGEKIDSRCFTYIITNGVFIEKKLESILSARIKTLNVSLNATTPDVHHKVMGLGEDAFEDVINGIRSWSAQAEPGSSFTLSMVLTADNIHQAADFVRMGNAMGAATVYLRTLISTDALPAGLNYHLLAPCLHPEFEYHRQEALKAIEESTINIEAQPETWASDCIPQATREKHEVEPLPIISRQQAIKDKALRASYQVTSADNIAGLIGEFVEEVDDLTFNPYRRSAPFDCAFVYFNLISTTLNWQLIPCCYMSRVPGHKVITIQPDRPFHDFWNSEAYVNLRRRLQQGPLYQACAECPMQGGY